MEKPDAEKLLYHLRMLECNSRGEGLRVVLPNEAYLALWQKYGLSANSMADWDFKVPESCKICSLIVEAYEPDDIKGYIRAI